MDIELDLYDQEAMRYCFLALISFMGSIYLLYVQLYREFFGLERKSGTGEILRVTFLVPLG